MLKLSKYLKPFLVSLFLAIILLFGQSFSDLNLPNYMSKIVNVGIQQNGIEHPAPAVVSEDGYRLIKSFMLDGERSLLDENYTKESVADYSGSISIDTQDAYVYVRNSVDEETLESLDDAVSISTWSMISFIQSQSGGQSQGGSASIGDITEVDVTKLYEMLPAFEMVPQQKIQEIRDAIDTEDMLITQSGIVFATAYVRELGANISSVQSSYIINVGLKMLLIAFLGGIATICVSLLSSRIASGVAKNLRRDVFSKIESFSNEEFTKFSTASLITRCTNDISQIQSLLTFGIRMVCYAPIMAIGGTMMALEKSVSMAWIIVAACIVLVVIIGFVVIFVMPKFKAIQKLVDRLNLVARENLSGLMVIRAFATQNHEKERFDVVNTDLASTSRFVNRVMGFMMPAMGFVMNGVSLLIVWVGAHQIAQSTMQVGDMMAFIQYAMQVISSFLMISMMFIFVPRAAVSASRIVEVLETEASIIDPKNPKAFNPAERGIVSFNDVTFRFGDSDEDTLVNIDFVAKPGETTAIIGPTGSGKSTIANLLLRFYDVTKGSITVDGVDIRDVLQYDLREKIGYVPQKGVLLSGTIASNLSYGKSEATREMLEEAARIAQAQNFIESKEETYDSSIAQGGTNVSGGQKQRLSIARALVKRPDIFIFDDSFSALDFKTDAELRKELKVSTGDSTMIIVAQRVNTIMNADQIIVLDNGRIVGKGTHRELLSTCPEYYEIASSQLSAEELA